MPAFKLKKSATKSLQQRAEGRYDLPLSRSGNSRFIILLVALMTFLAVLALSASFALSHIAAQWSSGLENKLTIEIPADLEDIQNLTIQVKKKLDNVENIKNVNVLSEDSISSLIAPWLGEDFALAEVPMPVLIAVESIENTPGFLASLQKELSTINDGIRVDAHEEWLNDFLRMIGVIKFVTIFVSLVIALTAVTAITGIIRARIAELKPDVELLHLIGAGDAYIAGQFQRYAMRLGLLGGAFGLFAGAIGLALFSLGTGSGNNLLPGMHISGIGVFVLLSLPFIACALCAFAAKTTVLRTLARMP